MYHAFFPKCKCVEPILLAQSKHCLWQLNMCSGFAAVSHWGFFHISLALPGSVYLSLPLDSLAFLGDILRVCSVSTLQLISCELAHRHGILSVLIWMNELLIFHWFIWIYRTVHSCLCCFVFLIFSLSLSLFLPLTLDLSLAHSTANKADFTLEEHGLLLLQLNGKLWPWKMKMLLPWELLILLSLKSCLAGTISPELLLIAHLFCIVPTSVERVAFHASV